MQKGFSLLELIITLAIAAIVVGMAAPSFSNMVQDNRLSSQSLDFVSALNLARSEAIKRGTPVTLCTSGDGLNCSDTGNWEQGWIVFADNVTNNQIRDEGEPILRIHGRLAGNNTLTGNQHVARYIVYTPDGRSNQIGTLSLCDSRKDNDKGKAIRISFTGRAMTSSITEALDDDVEAKECT